MQVIFRCRTVVRDRAMNGFEYVDDSRGSLDFDKLGGGAAG
jgi:hypothetical protein